MGENKYYSALSHLLSCANLITIRHCNTCLYVQRGAKKKVPARLCNYVKLASYSAAVPLEPLPPPAVDVLGCPAGI